ncbi:alpha/beta hydrolase family protein [Dokdonia sp. Hel_I_53]|uniref:S9 family peptidase n=1 Tax=Dokdonia sp. Hel_I_53 TaxID=1566287 RepID=UPI001199500E|nr:S9 family peptidase [Dokdonia sp. Hel_I_53]TVZ52536.1 dipeptidyl aminopeptidase/acylaminoacyl peptidase [Dokdonia sp. Hel_I_53]
MTTIIKFILGILLGAFAQIAMGQELIGTYKGILKVQGMEMELLYNFKNIDGNLTATMDVPLQGATDIPMDSAILEENKISITSAKLKMNYIGTLTNDKITGTYTQLGTDYPLDLMKTEKTIPGNPALPSSDAVLATLAAKETGDFKYTVEDYFKKSAVSGFTLSPDGNYISYMKRRENGKQDLYLKNTQTQKETLAVAQDEDVIRVHYWASEDRLLYLQDSKGDENYHVYGVNLDGSNKKDLTPYEGVRVDILAILKEDPKNIIIQMNKDDLKQNEPYKLNIATGAIEKLYSVKEGDPPVAGFDFDKDGNLRAITRVVNEIETEILYNIDGDFKQLKVVPFGDGFGILRFDYNSSYEHDAYVVSNLDSDKYQIQRFDLKENKVIETVYEDDTYDVSGISLSRKRNYEIDYFSHVAEKSVVVPVSSTYKKLHKRLKKEFGDKEFFTVGRTDEEDKFMIMLTSDRIVGEYHLYDVKKDQVKLLYKLLPHLKEKDMAAMEPITFKSRDGKTIHGYLTMPQGVKKGEKVPMIVNPHGGPQGLRDTWAFNQEAQLFASRGYATLHVNFRISGGYGKEFLNSGYGQIGRKVMDDIEDGIDYVIDQGSIDKDRVAIFGGSHGGYAVLRGMMKTPEKYACGVDYVGVSNLNTFMTTFPPYWENYRAIVEKIWYNPEIPEEQEIMDEISPALHTDKIVKPLFVVQGANDPRVNIDEADQIVAQLRERGVSVPYMVKYDEGHGFAKEENRLDLYKTMMGFFAEHLK